MSRIVEEIKGLQPKEKAEIYQLLVNDKELTGYMISEEVLSKELERRDAAFARGEIKLTYRENLLQRLKRKRHGG